MEKKMGFTLVELLGVIILMGLISAAIATPILAQINKTSTKIDETALKLLYSDTELYMTKYSNSYKKISGNVYYITVEQLIESGLLEKEFIDSYSDSVLSKNTQIKVNVMNNSYQYEIPITQLTNIAATYNNMSVTSTYNYAGGTYIKGTNSNNYVLYNGFIWRIMGLNQDGSVKLIMDELATSLIYSSNISYPASYVRQWLNDYFISHLQYNGNIVKQKWYYKAPSSASNTNVSLTDYVEDKVGLLSVEEFNLSLSSDSSYLKSGKYGLINQSDIYFYTTYSSNNVPINGSYNSALFVKPVINVFGSTIVSGGNGTSSNPYILAEYKNSKSTKTIYDANIPLGSYLSIDSKKYRVIEKSIENTKVISYFTPTTSSIYANTDNTFNLANGAGYALNSSSSIPSKFLKTNIFLGGIYSDGLNYKNSVFSKKNIVYDVYLSLPIMGEFLTNSLYPSTLQSTCFWSLNMISSTEAYSICNAGATKANISASNSLVYTGYISSNNKIASGSGTSSDPYIIE